MQKFSPFIQNKKKSLSLSGCSMEEMYSSLSLSSSMISQYILANNVSQQFQLVNTFIWRQKTSMPIIKVLNYKTQLQTFPKTYSVQLQHIEKSVKSLSDIQLKDALYLIQQCLLGVQALSYKYHCFDFSKVYYGINEKGQCKTWLNQNLIQFKRQQFPLPSQDIIINQIMKMIFLICDNQSKLELNEFIHQTSRLLNIGFSRFHIKLSQFANKKKILLPNHIFIDKRSSLFSKAKSQVQKSICSQQKRTTPIKVNFRYQSPLPRHLPNCQRKNSLTQKIGLCKISKPKITWQYENIPQNLYKIALKRAMTDQSSNYQSRITNQQKSKPVQNMLSSPNKLKNRLIASKESIKQSPKISYPEVANSLISCNYQKSQKTCTSLTMNQNLLMINQSNIMTLSQNNNKKNNILCQKSHLSDQYEVKISSIESILQNNQQKIEKNQQKHYQKIFNFGSYNFGGLLPLPQKSIKQSQQVDDNIFINQQFKPLLYNKRNQQRILRSLVLSHEDLNSTNINYDRLWQNKMSKLLTQDTSNLKQSVYCGQEKKSQPLQIKLHLLGRLGREITSFIPQSNEH